MNRWAHGTRQTAAMLGFAAFALSSNALPIHEDVTIEGDMQALCIKNYGAYTMKTVYVLTATSKKVATVPTEGDAPERIDGAQRGLNGVETDGVEYVSPVCDIDAPAPTGHVTAANHRVFNYRNYPNTDVYAAPWASTGATPTWSFSWGLNPTRTTISP
jgi:hypothetical protein